MWENMQEAVRNGTSSPSGELLEDNGTVVLLDRHGNQRGGIRLPIMDVPKATYGVSNALAPGLPGFLAPLGNLFCVLSGSEQPFDLLKLANLYPNHGVYVNQVVAASNDLVQDGFLLHEDAATLRRRAALEPLGFVHCGIGFELALILPPLMWLRRRFRRA